MCKYLTFQFPGDGKSILIKIPQSPFPYVYSGTMHRTSSKVINIAVCLRNEKELKLLSEAVLSEGVGFIYIGLSIALMSLSYN